MPALVVPMVGLRVTAKVASGFPQDVLRCAFYRGPLSAVPPELQGLAALVGEGRMRSAVGAAGILITIESDIPVGYGLGSSAAAAAAVARALYRFQGVDLPQSELLRLVNISEKHAHGTPSGIDARAVTMNSPLWFIKDQAIEPVKLGRGIFVIVATSASPGNTGEAVKLVRKKIGGYSQADPIQELGRLAHEARAMLGQGNVSSLGEVLVAAHEQLARLGVSTPHLDDLVQAALRAGALGAKLTGGGLGGAMLALTSSPEGQKSVVEALQAAGAGQVWSVELKGEH